MTSAERLDERKPLTPNLPLARNKSMFADASGLHPIQLSKFTSVDSRMTLHQPMGRMSTIGSANKRRSGFTAALLNGIPKAGEKHEADIKSRKTRDFHGDIALAQISQRIKKQAQDQFGNVQHFIDHQKTTNKDPEKKLFGRIKADDGLESVHEQDPDDEDDFDWVEQAPRRTLLDRVVGNIFGKEKQRLYEMYPKLAVITVPKMPIITPKGDEIIHRNKFKTQLQLLNTAYN